MTDAEAQSAPPSAPLEDKPQPERKVIATLVQGTVKWFNVRNGYGFINRNDTKEDVFVHQTAIKKNNPTKFLRSVGDGEVVEFDVIEAPKGSEAANVTGPGGIPVKGSRYAPNKRRFRRRFFPRSPRPGDQSQPADGPAPTEGEGDGDGSGGNMAPRPPQRRRRPRRPQQVEAGDQRDSETQDTQETQPPPQRRFWRPYRRPFRPRPAPEQPAEGQQTAAPEQTQEQVEEKQPEAPQTNGDTAPSRGQRPRRPSRRQRQRNSESSTSKNDTEKSASEPGTPPQTSKPIDLNTTPKTSPDTPEPPEQEAATTVPAPTE